VTRTRAAIGSALLVVALLATACTGSSGASPSASPSTGSSSIGTPQAGAQDPAKPNIVFVLTDDLAWNLVSDMPHVQALQHAGSTMSKYYVADSLCCPSRSAIFTGQYSHDNGVFTNGGSDGGYNAYNSHGDEQKSFALALQNNGYRTGFMGKYLNGYQPKDPVPPGWNTWDVTGKGYREFNYHLNENGTQHAYGHQSKDYLTDVLSAKGGSFISSAASSGTPFILEVATFAPHAPYVPAPRYADAAKSVSYPKTPAYDAAPSDPPSWLSGDAALTSAQQHQLAGFYRKRVQADMAVDDMIGHLEQQLQASGAASNTYFVFSSDNGYHLGEYRLLAGKQTAFDTDIHVPLIVSGPGVPAGRTVNQLSTNVDLAPTFESITGSQVGSTVDGLSLADLWHGKAVTDWPQAVLVEHHGRNDDVGDPDAQDRAHADPPTYGAVRTADALYVRYTNGQQEFYDTSKDPYELHNLAGQGVPAALPKTLTALEGCHDAAACRSAARL